MKSKRQIVFTLACMAAVTAVNAQEIASNANGNQLNLAKTKILATDLSLSATPNTISTTSLFSTTPSDALNTTDGTDNAQNLQSTDGGYHRSSGGDGIAGKNIVYAGVGFVGGLALLGTLYTAEGYTASSVPTISVAYERGLSEHWGVGFTFNYSSVTLNSSGTIDNTFGDQGSANVGEVYSYTNKFSITGMGFGVTGAYHFTVSSDKFDPYVGAALGYTSIAFKYTTNDPNSATDGNATGGIALAGSGALFGGFLGARYYFTDNIGLWADIGYLGYGGSLINVGLVAKF